MAATLLVIGGVRAPRPAGDSPNPGRGPNRGLRRHRFPCPSRLLLPPLLGHAESAAGARTSRRSAPALQLVGAALFLGAVVVYRRLWLRDRSVADAFVTVGLLFAAFAMAIGASTAGSHPGPVTIADALWLAFNVTLLLAIEAEARVILRALRQAN